MTESAIRVCPKCGGKTRYYHDSGGISRVVCKGDCPEWTVIKEYDQSKGEVEKCLNTIPKK